MRDGVLAFDRAEDAARFATCLEADLSGEVGRGEAGGEGKGRRGEGREGKERATWRVPCCTSQACTRGTRHVQRPPPAQHFLTRHMNNRLLHQHTPPPPRLNNHECNPPPHAPPLLPLPPSPSAQVEVMEVDSRQLFLLTGGEAQAVVVYLPWAEFSPLPHQLAAALRAGDNNSAPPQQQQQQQ